MTVRGSLCIDRGFVPQRRREIDKTLKETIMKHAKSPNQASYGKGSGLFKKKATTMLVNYGYVQHRKAQKPMTISSTRYENS